MSELLLLGPGELNPVESGKLPTIIDLAGPRASFRFAEFFAAEIRNPNTRRAYYRATCDFFRWCEEFNFTLDRIGPLHVAAYIEKLQSELSRPSVKQALAAIRMLFDYLVLGQVVPANPAANVRGPKYSTKRGKTPVLSSDEARQLLDSIKVESSVVGLRDRALIGLMVYTFARVGAAIGMNVEDWYFENRKWWVRLHEKGGKLHAMPVHHRLTEFVAAYLEAATIGDKKATPSSERHEARHSTSPSIA